MIGLYIWLGFVLLVIYIGFRSLRNSLLKNISGISNYREAIPIHKEGFERSQFPIIKTIIRGKSRYFLVDSGANHNMIDSEEYHKLLDGEELVSKGSINMVGIGTTDKSPAIEYKFVEDTLKIGNTSHTTLFGIGDSWKTAKEAVAQHSGLPLIGILGSEFIKNAGWIIDYSNLTIWVKDIAYGIKRT